MSSSLRFASFTTTLVAVSMLAACNAREPVVDASASRRPEEVGPRDVAGSIIAADIAAMRGDQKAVQAHMHKAQDDFRRAIKLADPSRPVDRELARVASRSVAGVRSVVWLDRENLFVIVEENEQKSQETIDAICLQMEPLGDTLGVVVNLQSGAARTGDELEILSRNCQLAPGDRAMMQKHRQVDVLDPAVREQHAANNGRR